MILHNDTHDREYRAAIRLQAREITDQQMQRFEGYAAHENIIGSSRLTRLVRLFSKRFAVQERIGQQIADALETMLHPHGVAVFLEANHLCVQMRGVGETAPKTRTTVWRGRYAEDASLCSEFFSACGLHRNAK